MNVESTLISPYGGALVDLIVPAEARAALKERASRLPSIQLSERALYDLEAPEHPELTLDTVVTTPEDNARRVLAHLERAGFVR